MMFCSHCGSKMVATPNFIGTKRIHVCPKCGKEKLVETRECNGDVLLHETMSCL